MTLTLQERERLAYIKGDTATTELLREALDAETRESGAELALRKEQAAHEYTKAHAEGANDRLLELVERAQQLADTLNELNDELLELAKVSKL